MATILYRLPFPNPNRADGFGAVKGRPHPHRGVDFPQPAGTPIPAIAAGTVALVEHSTELGWCVVVKHARTTAERIKGRKPVFSGYAHMSTNPGLTVGAAVRLGETIGHVGAAGKNGTAATGAHLHLTMSHDVRGIFAGDAFDPLRYIAARDGGEQAAAVPHPPARVKTYTVKKGDTLSRIASAHHVAWPMLAELNGLDNPDHIEVGQVLRLS
jgi:murein DD-endopeptidase MepM/ murein hydrolase activator NlpD